MFDFKFPTKILGISSHLTKREEEITVLIAEGLSSKEIAKKLFISIKTVETHRTKIMEKLQVNNIAEVVRYAIKTGLIQA